MYFGADRPICGYVGRRAEMLWANGPMLVFTYGEWAVVPSCCYIVVVDEWFGWLPYFCNNLCNRDIGRGKKNTYIYLPKSSFPPLQSGGPYSSDSGEIGGRLIGVQSP